VILIRRGEMGGGGYLEPILAVPPLRGARRIWSALSLASAALSEFLLRASVSLW
jgi:hypothetical protein